MATCKALIALYNDEIYLLGFNKLDKVGNVAFAEISRLSNEWYKAGQGFVVELWATFVRF